jgi:ABC-type multidrug transport system fused ATPase/permease subunit
MIGAKGLNLSEGQKQRLSIARSLVKDPDILILDEPTAALDSASEKSIFDALPYQVSGKTVLVASHRISTIMQADRILLLNDRGIANIGTHQSLLESNDCYQAMVANQKTGGLAEGV